MTNDLMNKAQTYLMVYSYRDVVTKEAGWSRAPHFFNKKKSPIKVGPLSFQPCIIYLFICQNFLGMKNTAMLPQNRSSASL